MFRPLKFFLESGLSTECDDCERQFPLSAGGVCFECRRVLCSRHLYGSWFRRLATDFGAKMTCVACREKENSAKGN